MATNPLKRAKHHSETLPVNWRQFPKVLVIHTLTFLDFLENDQFLSISHINRYIKECAEELYFSKKSVFLPLDTAHCCFRQDLLSRYKNIVKLEAPISPKIVALLPYCTQLRSLKLTQVKYTTTEIFTTALSMCQNLTELFLEVRSLTSRCTQAICQRAPTLQHLGMLLIRPSFSEENLIEIAKQCKQLYQLSISNGHPVFCLKKYVGSFITHCKTLRCISLDNCDSVQFLLDCSRENQLEELVITRNQQLKLDARMLKKLRQTFTHLACIRLNGTTTLLDRA